MLLVDKHRPRDLSELVVHTGIGERLQALARTGDVPHALFYGSPGAGKKTLVMCLLRELFGPAAERLRVESKAWKVAQSGRNLNVEIRVLSSPCHVEVNPSDAGLRDRHVVSEMLKDIARSKPLDSHSQPFKVLVLNEVDKLSKEAQHALRRTMERYSSSCRLLLVCNSLSKVCFR
jgi:replication factor C subunit 3/5